MEKSTRQLLRLSRHVREIYRQLRRLRRFFLSYDDTFSEYRRLTDRDIEELAERLRLLELKVGRFEKPLEIGGVT